MRLFLALPLSEEVVERLTSFRLRWSVPEDGLRWSTPEQWHITLQYYGEVNEGEAQHLIAKLSQLHAPAPSLTVERLGLFQAKGILFAAVEPSPALLALYSLVAASGKESGLLPESRPFHPHITLARSKGRVGHASLKRLSMPHVASIGAALRWTPDACLLMESILYLRGAEYTVRSRIPLQKSPVPHPILHP